MKKYKKSKIIGLFIAILLAITGYFKDDLEKLMNNSVLGTVFNESNVDYSKSYDMSNIPDYSGENIIVINNNNPEFSIEDKTTVSFEKYSDLDYLNRCGVAYANISEETMPNRKRESISGIRPSGWQTKRYNHIDGKYLYNRCHLIGYQLTGENANEKNLITCTREMNAVSMLEYENKVASYIKNTGNHVLYRVTPMFEEENLVATGVQMEGYSVEDDGKGIKFNIFIYNVQDGVEIDYKTGKSKLK